MKENKVCIIVDSCSGIRNNEIDDVYVVPLSIIEKTSHGETVYKDLEEITPEDVIKKTAENADLKTSQTSFGEMITIFEALTPKYQKIFVLPISRGLSGSYNTWNMAKEEFSKNEIIILDGCDLSHGIKDMVLDIKEMISKNKNDNEIIEYVEDHKRRRLGILIINDLTQLKKGGRINSFKAFIAKTLKLNILIEFNGSLNFFGKDTSMDKAIEKALNKINEETHYAKNGIKRGYIYSTYLDKEFNDSIRKKVSEKVNFELSLDYVPAVIAVHTGAKTFAIYIESKKY
ncbi:MAG: DegV family protein [Malacoplasma sp.]|nr:DegV family protein [Malacoplasma sp.]